MRNYELMRTVLFKAANTTDGVSPRQLLVYGEFDEVKEEVQRLAAEGLIEHNITWEAQELANGKITGTTKEGREFLRNIENERVWLIVEQTLKAANLDLSYPLLKEVCEEIVKRYVMAKIPNKF